MSIFDLLEEVRKRPSMYVGASNSERGEQLRNLELVLAGYAMAVMGHGIPEPVADFPREFGKYLQERFDWSVACGPIAAIRDAATDNQDAWEMFWRLVEEFRNSLVSEKK